MTGQYVAFSRLRKYMNEQSIEKAISDLPNIKGLLCYAFPYFAGESEGNISLYARGKDYHKVVGKKLAEYCEELKKEFPQNSFLPYVDVSPFPEVTSAALAGLGKKGKHGLLITPDFGSYIFIGVIATDLQLDGGNEIPTCNGCNACIKACPNKALTESGFDKCRCLSEITQKKGELSPEEKALMVENNAFWGCDRCQRACPENRKVALTPIDEFKTDLICSLSSQDLQESNKQLQKKYSDRAFIWRGAAILKRNAEILEKQGEENG